jgi:dihydrofolate reductase
MDQAAEDVVTSYSRRRQVGARGHCDVVAVRWPQVTGPMRAKVPRPSDQHPVGDLRSEWPAGDSFAGAWPGREAAGGDDAPFTRQLGDMRKVVVSRRQLEFSWRNSELIKGDLLDAVTALKADAGIGGILIPGSISVVQQLLAAGLVDELRLLVHPVAARKGRRLFDDGDAPYHLKVTATEAFPTGVIRVIYSPAEAPAMVGYDEIKNQAPAGR